MWGMDNTCKPAVIGREKFQSEANEGEGQTEEKKRDDGRGSL